MFVGASNRNLNTKYCVLSSYKWMFRDEADFRIRSSKPWGTSLRTQVFGVSLHPAVLLLMVLVYE